MFEMSLVRIHIKPDLSRLPVYRRAAERYPTDRMIQSLYSLALRMSGQEEEAKRVWDAYQERVAQSEPVPAIPHGLSCPGSTKLGDQSQDSLKRYEELFEQIEEEMRREKSTTERDCEDEGTEKGAPSIFEIEQVRIHIKPDLSRLPVYRRAAERYPTDGMIQSLYSLALRMSGQEEEAKRVRDAYHERVAQSRPVPAIPHGLSCPGSTTLEDQSQDLLKRYEELFEQIEEEMRQEKSTTERDCEDEGTES